MGAASVLFHLFHRVSGLVPRLDPAGMAVNIPVAEFDGPHRPVVAPGALGEPAVKHQHPVFVGTEKLLDNARALLTSLVRAKPAASKGNYLQSVAVSATMGPGVRVDPAVHLRVVRKIQFTKSLD